MITAEQIQLSFLVTFFRWKCKKTKNILGIKVALGNMWEKLDRTLIVGNFAKKLQTLH